MFSKLCDDNNKIYNHLQLHIEVRWLSKVNCLARFNKLYSSLNNSNVKHIETIDIELHGELKNIKYDLAYLSDIFEHLNINNTSFKVSIL